MCSVSIRYVYMDIVCLLYFIFDKNPLSNFSRFKIACKEYISNVKAGGHKKYIKKLNVHVYTIKHRYLQFFCERIVSQTAYLPATLHTTSWTTPTLPTTYIMSFVMHRSSSFIVFIE